MQVDPEWLHAADHPCSLDVIDDVCADAGLSSAETALAENICRCAELTAETARYTPTTIAAAAAWCAVVIRNTDSDGDPSKQDIADAAGVTRQTLTERGEQVLTAYISDPDFDVEDYLSDVGGGCDCDCV